MVSKSIKKRKEKEKREKEEEKEKKKLQDTQTTIKNNSESFEVHVDPLIPLWKKKALEKAEVLAKKRAEQKRTEKRLREKMDKYEHLQSDYLRYLKEREEKNIQKFNWGICCYKCFCCWREKPAEAYFEYKPRIPISPEILPEYRKPYGVPPDVFYKLAGKEGYETLGWELEGVSICSCDPIGEMIRIPDTDPSIPPWSGATQGQTVSCDVQKCTCT